MTRRRRAKVGHIKVIIERAEDGYVAYPLGMKGIVVGQGDSYEEALSDVTSAIQAHVKEFGPEALQADTPVVDAFVAEVVI